MRKINPLNDVAFKMTMGEAGDEVQLKGFIEAVTGRKFKSVEIVGAMELNPDIIGNKTSRLDVLGKMDDNTEVNVEVQLKNYHNMKKRSPFYWGRRFGNALKAGSENDYESLPDVIAINILGFGYLDEEPDDEFHNVYQIMNKRSGNVLDSCLEIHFIEMPKFLKLENKDVKSNKIHRWLAFFDSNISETTLRELVEMDAAIREAESRIEYITNDEEAYRLIMLREKGQMDYDSAITTATRKGRAEGRAEGEAAGMAKGEAVGMAKGEAVGMAKGEAVGMAKGEAVGMAKGRAEGRAETAKNLIKIGLPTEQIAQVANLTIDEINKLKESIQ